MDDDVDKLLDDLSNKDMVGVGQFIKKYEIRSDSLVGRIILKLMGGA